MTDSVSANLTPDTMASSPRMIETICKQCGKTFLGRYQRVIRGKAQFCSHRCAGKFNAHGNASHFKNGPKKIRPKSTEKERIRAKSKVRTAVQQGKLISHDVCEKCGGTSNVEAHHENYSEPLNVVWLCRSCHMKRHYEIGRDSPN